MSSGESRWQAVPEAQLSWDGGAPRSAQFEDIYYSRDSGLEESRFVFMRGNDLPERWQGRAHHTILETGFGTGLNFLATWHAWRSCEHRCRHLHYIALEQFPLQPRDLAKALGYWPELAALSQQLLATYPSPLPGQHRLHFDDNQITLDLVYAPAEEGLDSLQQDPQLTIDSWFLDGFAPSRNPDMWTPKLYRSMAALSTKAATFATFTAAGKVRRDLQEVGFDVVKVPGFGTKKEMLSGVLCSALPSRGSRYLNWDRPAQTPSIEDKQAIILGAGLAGATTAAALARRGWRVTVLEAEAIAGAASGNLQGVLYTRLSHRPSPLNSFSVHSYCYALRQYRALFDSGALSEGSDGQFCGALHLLDNWDDTADFERTVTSLPSLARYLDASASAAVSGLELCPAGLFFPNSGWIHPPALCRALLAHPNIEVREHCGTLQPVQEAQHWQVFDGSGKLLQQTQVLVLATGFASKCVPQTNWLPLQKIRGQVTHLPSQGTLQALRTVLCHEGYLPPARGGQHCLGATFDLRDEDTQLRPDSHQFNLDKLSDALGLDLDLQSPDLDKLEGRVGFRCASPDYLPIVGPVVDHQHLLSSFGFLRKNARQSSPIHGRFHPGLYITTAHGSRGLTSTPLAAELLASQITAEASPLPRDLVQALSPGRFLIRDLIRNRV